MNNISDAKPPSKFRIPKKARSESESSNNSSSVAFKEEPGSDSEPELHIAEVDPDDSGKTEEVKQEPAPVASMLSTRLASTNDDVTVKVKQEVSGNFSN